MKHSTEGNRPSARRGVTAAMVKLEERRAGAADEAGQPHANGGIEGKVSSSAGFAGERGNVRPPRDDAVRATLGVHIAGNVRRVAGSLRLPTLARTPPRMSATALRTPLAHLAAAQGTSGIGVPWAETSCQPPEPARKTWV